MDEDMMRNWTFRLSVVVLTLALLASDSGRCGGIVINELHVDPDVKTELVEFVELHNTDRSSVDLSGWSFTSGIAYTFPAGTTLAGQGYLVVAQQPDDMLGGRTQSGFNVSAADVFGPFVGKLSNEGDRVTLCDADGQVVDEVTYKLGFPWPTVGDPTTNDQPGDGGVDAVDQSGVRQRPGRQLAFGAADAGIAEPGVRRQRGAADSAGQPYAEPAALG